MRKNAAIIVLLTILILMASGLANAQGDSRRRGIGGVGKRGMHMKNLENLRLLKLLEVLDLNDDQNDLFISQFAKFRKNPQKV